VALYNLASNCDYGEMQDQMIRDRLVVGIRDNSVSERLQMDPELTLEKAKKAIQQKEAVKGHQSVLNTDQLQTSSPIDTIKGTTLPQ